jgi:hypothetical protein
VSHSHRFLIGPPLLIISVFCFIFVLMQPHVPTQVLPSASSHPVPTSGKADSSVSPISLDGHPTLTKLTPAPLITDQTDSATATSITNSPSATTSSPQLSNTSTTGLQAGSPNNQKTNSSGKQLQTQVQDLIYKLTR